uniref:Uncharacterized protein n=1 Tax=Bubo bubo TaxID=30461 RepID=A0A8C0ES12_BUBBB
MFPSLPAILLLSLSDLFSVTRGINSFLSCSFPPPCSRSVSLVAGRSLRYLIIENFIPPEEKNKIMNRLYFDGEEDQWKFQPLVPTGGNSNQMKKRPTSAVGYKRPISQYARVAMAMGSHPRYRAENIMFLELDLSPPAIFEFERSKDPAEQDPRALHLERLMHLDSLLERPAASRVRKSRSW